MASLPNKNKKGTVQRTTSETLRLGDSESNHAQPPPSSVRASGQSSNQRKKSQSSQTSSFQITGVSLCRTDFGDESADDLDESHTDDVSRITDNETPSFSEDSRDTDDLHQQSAVQQLQSPQQQQAPQQPQQQQQQQQQPPQSQKNLGRFKVVKIESIAPFCRGRWTCFDYLDRPDKPSHGQKTDKQPTTIRCASNKEVEDNRHIQNPSNMNFWDPHCQEYMYRAATTPAGTMSLPKQIHLPISGQQQKFNRAQQQQQQNHPNTTVTYIHDNTRMNENNTAKDMCKQDHTNVIRQQEQLPQQQQQAKEKLDSNVADSKNVLNRFTLATPESSSQIVRYNDNVTEKMATSHHHSVDTSSNVQLTTTTQQQQQQTTTGDVPINELSLVVSDLDFNEATFFAVYCFTRNFVGASVSCTATIDTKIENALDVVKTHLTRAVRLEVDELKIKINELVDRISYLEYENALLRANVAPDVLARLGGNNRSEK